MDAVCLELVNSEVWFGLGPLEDRLASDPGWLDGFLTRFSVAVQGRRTKHELDELIRLRALLRRLIETVAAGRPLPPADLAKLNTFLATRPVTRALARSADAYKLKLSPVRPDWNWVLAEVAASFADLIVSGEPARIKICANAECRWAFYDETKNRRRRWCDSAICGNRDKVRRFRERARTSS
jgi:predicted RNA-binding Zn ribbon-like protein